MPAKKTPSVPETAPVDIADLPTATADAAPAGGDFPTPQAEPARDPRRVGAPEWIKAAPGAVLDAVDRFSSAMNGAKGTIEAAEIARAFAADLEKLAKDPDAVAPVEAGFTEVDVDVPGHGNFTVRINKNEKVELTALSEIGGTGLMKGEKFAESPARAVQLVIMGGAAPRQLGGVRRSKVKEGAPAGEPEASAA